MANGHEGARVGTGHKTQIVTEAATLELTKQTNREILELCKRLELLH